MWLDGMMVLNILTPEASVVVQPRRKMNFYFLGPTTWYEAHTYVVVTYAAPYGRLFQQGGGIFTRLFAGFVYQLRWWWEIAMLVCLAPKGSTCANG